MHFKEGDRGRSDERINSDFGDDCGLSNIQIFIDDESIEDYYPSATETTFSFTLNDTHDKYGDWFMEIGTHNITIILIEKNGLNSSVSGVFETTFDDMREYVKWKIDNLNQKLQTSLDDYWRHPVDSHKNAMDNKLTALKHMIDTLVFLDAYNKLLHDIKPKLTGLKTDENGNPWGNGVFNNPWVEDNNFQEELLVECNELLLFIQILMSVN